MTLWNALIIAASISTAIATIADMPPHVLNTNSAIAQEKQLSSKLLRTLSGHISPDGKIIASGSDDGTIKL